MPPIGPIKRADLIRYLRQSELTGPRTGTNHEYMQRGQLKIPIPNPHRGDISVDLASAARSGNSSRALP